MTNVAADDKMNDVIRSYPVTRCWCFVSHIYLLNWLANWTIAIDLQDDPGHPSATPGHFAMLSHFIVAAYHPNDVIQIYYGLHDPILIQIDKIYRRNSCSSPG